MKYMLLCVLCWALQVNAGVNFIRWGGGGCAFGGGIDVYRGYVAKTPTFSSMGGGSTYLCLPTNPQWPTPIVPGLQGNSRISGTEFKHWGLGAIVNIPPFVISNHKNIMCTVCDVTLASQQLMIPGWITCPTGWKQQYTGYLMAEPNYRWPTRSQSSYICVYKRGVQGTDGVSFPHAIASIVETWCGTLPCSTYPTGRELGCVVCTK